MSKYSGSGWHFQSERHSKARKYGKAGGTYSSFEHHDGKTKPQIIYTHPARGASIEEQNILIKNAVNKYHLNEYEAEMLDKLMKTRFKGEESQSYINEWAGRIKTGHPQSYADSETLKIINKFTDERETNVLADLNREQNKKNDFVNISKKDLDKEVKKSSKHFGSPETAGQVLERLSNFNQSSEQDGRIMQAVLKQAGFPNAVVVGGVVYLEGHGTINAPPTSIHAVAKSLLKAVAEVKETKHYGKRISFQTLTPSQAQKMIDESKGMSKQKFDKLWDIAHHPISIKAKKKINEYAGITKSTENSITFKTEEQAKTFEEQMTGLHSKYSTSGYIRNGKTVERF
jgi:hypothetical protein